MNKFTVKPAGLIELHLHIDGSISPASARELADIAKIKLPKSDVELEELLTVEKDCRDLQQYLARFDLPLSLFQTEETIETATYNLCTELKAEGHIYSELRFAPQSCCKMGLSQEQTVKAAIKGLYRSGLNGAVILCCMRSGEDNAAENLETVRLTEKYLGSGVCACDLAGAEALFPNPGYKYIFDRAKELKLPYTIHAGEALGADSVGFALDFGALRIGHGVRAIESDKVMERIKREHIPLEMCPTSNLQTCVFSDFKASPYDAMIRYGLPVTISSDNRSVSGTDVRRELQILADTFGYGENEIKALLLNAADAAFASDDTKRSLRAQINSIY